MGGTHVSSLHHSGVGKKKTVSIKTDFTVNICFRQTNSFFLFLMKQKCNSLTTLLKKKRTQNCLSTRVPGLDQ
jgi:hypothetical protein